MGGIKTKLLDWLYLSPIRSYLRRLGLINCFSLLSKMQTQLQYFKYNQTHPTSVKVEVDNQRATLLVSNKQEYVRVLSVKNDKHILRALINHVKPGYVFWDVGANIGLYTVLLAKAVGEGGTVVAFEPEKNSFKRLIENIKFNKLTNVYSVNIALGKEIKKMKLAVSNHYASGTHSLAEHDRSHQENYESQSVEVLRGDVFLLQEKKEVPNVIKIDVEGLEEDVLIGLDETLKNYRCSLVVCEVHFSILNSIGRKEAPAKIITYLKDRGFNDHAWLDYSHLIASKNNILFAN